MKDNNQFFVCPNCHENLDFDSNTFLCQNCKCIFPIDGTIADFLLTYQKDKSTTLKNRASHFDDLSKVYESSTWKGSPMIVAWFLTRKIRNRDGIGLDIACGTGVVARSIAKKINYTYGIDISMGMLQKAVVLSQKASIKNITFSRCDVENLPFEDGSFDFISCSGALHAFPDAENSLREMQRILKTDGTLAIMTLLTKNTFQIIDPTKREIKQSSTKEDVIKFNKAHDSMAKIDVKLHRFTLDELKMLINNLGFKNFKHHKFGPIIIFSVEK